MGLQRHLIAIAVCILLFSCLGGLLTYYLLTTYKAEAVVLYQEDLPKTLPGGITLNNPSLTTALDLISLPANYQAVIAQLGLNLNTKQMEKMIDVPLPARNSHLIRIIATSDNPNLAVDIANSLAKVAVKRSQDFFSLQLQEEVNNFKNQLDEVNQRLTKELQEIENFKKAHRYFEMTADYSTLISQLTNARNKVQAANLKYNSLLVEYENLKRESATLPERFDARGSYLDERGSEREDPLLARIYSLQENLAEARAKYAPENPKVKILEEQLKTLTQQSKSEENSSASTGTSSSSSASSNPYYERGSSKDAFNIRINAHGKQSPVCTKNEGRFDFSFSKS